MESNRLILFIIGDPIIDVWSSGQENDNGTWTSSLTEKRLGGAANTAGNARSILGNDSGYTFKQFPSHIHKLIRLKYLNSEDNKTLTVWDYFGKQTEMYLFPGGTPLFNKRCFGSDMKGLIISDYNKGTVNLLTRNVLPVFEFAVVDSKYRSLDMSWLRTSKIKIWHCTGSEYDDAWAENFNYTINTDGADDVTIICNETAQAFELSVPDTKVVDTIGAGDTFTAAVGAWLSYVMNQGLTDDITFDDVCDATRFAIWCCQDVITKKYTAVCKRTLKQYLEE